MAKLIGELLLELAQSLVGDLLKQIMLRVGAWLDGRLASRRTRIVAGLLLGVAIYFLIPVNAGLIGL